MFFWIYCTQNSMNETRLVSPWRLQLSEAKICLFSFGIFLWYFQKLSFIRLCAFHNRIILRVHRSNQTNNKIKKSENVINFSIVKYNNKAETGGPVVTQAVWGCGCESHHRIGGTIRITLYLILDWN